MSLGLAESVPFSQQKKSTNTLCLEITHALSYQDTAWTYAEFVAVLFANSVSDPLPARQMNTDVGDFKYLKLRRVLPDTDVHSLLYY